MKRDRRTTDAREDARSEIRLAMAFYEKRGWDWLLLVEYLAWRANNGKSCVLG